MTLPQDLPAGTKVVCTRDYLLRLKPEDYDPNTIPLYLHVYTVSNKKSPLSRGYYLQELFAGYWWSIEDFDLLRDFEPDD